MAKKEKAQKVKKPIFKRVWFWLLVLLVAAVVYGATIGKDVATTTGTNEYASVTTEAPATQQETVTADTIKEWIDGGISEGDTIAATFDNRTIDISVTLGNLGVLADMPEEAAESRVSSITDALLEHTELDGAWDTVVIHFDGIGRFTFTPSGIQTGDAGRYFDTTNDDGTVKIEAE